jgi:hypothetical protein
MWAPLCCLGYSPPVGDRWLRAGRNGTGTHQEISP